MAFRGSRAVAFRGRKMTLWSLSPEKQRTPAAAGLSPASPAPLGEPVASVLTPHLNSGDTITRDGQLLMTLTKNVIKTKFTVIQIYF